MRALVGGLEFGAREVGKGWQEGTAVVSVTIIMLPTGDELLDLITERTVLRDLDDHIILPYAPPNPRLA